MPIEEKVVQLFASFIRDLAKTFPEIKSPLYRDYEDMILYSSDNPEGIQDSQKINDFLDKIGAHDQLILDKDEALFELDDNFLKDISFKKLWCKSISFKTKATIWKYLQTFAIINIKLKPTREVCGSKNTPEDLLKLKLLTESLKSRGAGAGAGAGAGLSEMMSGLMDSNIATIAKDVASDMKLEDIFSGGESALDNVNDPADIMKLFDPSKLGDIFQKIDKAMQQEIGKGTFSREDLAKEAGDIQGQFSSNPEFADLMGKMGDPAQMALMAQMAQMAQMAVNPVNPVDKPSKTSKKPVGTTGGRKKKKK